MRRDVQSRRYSAPLVETVVAYSRNKHNLEGHLQSIGSGGSSPTADSRGRIRRARSYRNDETSVDMNSSQNESSRQRLVPRDDDSCGQVRIVFFAIMQLEDRLPNFHLISDFN